MVLFDSPIFTEGILPFVLIFVLVFAILQKTKILGDGKRQIDALVALVIGLILITVPVARDIVVNLMPWIAVGVAVILTFLILYGFVSGDLSKSPKWMKIVFGILAGIFVLSIVVYVTGVYETIWGWFGGSGGSELWLNILLIVIIIGVVAVAVATGKKSGSSSEKSDKE